MAVSLERVETKEREERQQWKLVHSQSLSTRSTPLCLKWAPSGDFCAVSLSRGGLQIWEARSKSALMHRWHSEHAHSSGAIITSLSWRCGGKSMGLVTSGDDRVVQTWDKSSLRSNGALTPIDRFNWHSHISVLICHPNQSQTMVICDRDWKVSTVHLSRGGLQMKHSVTLSDRVCDACFTQDGNHVLCGTRDGRVTVLNLGEGLTLSRIKTFVADTGGCRGIAMDPKESLLAVGGHSGLLSVWKTIDLSCVASVCPAQRRRSLQKRQSESMMGVNLENLDSHHDRDRGSDRSGRDPSKSTAAVTKVKFNSDGSILAGMSDVHRGMLDCVNVSSAMMKEPNASLMKVNFPSEIVVRSFEWHPSEKDILTVLNDGYFQFWRLIQ